MPEPTTILPQPLTFGPSKGLRRVLDLSYRYGNLTVIVYAPTQKRSTVRRRRMLAYSSVPLDQCRILINAPDENCLWVGMTAFDVSMSEIEKLREAIPSLRVSDERVAAGGVTA